MLYITDSVPNRTAYQEAVLPIEDHHHCRRVLQTLAIQGVRLSAVRIHIHNQETLLAALDVDLLSRIVQDEGVIHVISPIQNHYLIQHVGSLLGQMHRIQVVQKHSSAEGCLGRGWARVCPYLPFTASLIRVLGRLLW